MDSERQIAAFVEASAPRLARAQAVSFDVFDTLLERPFAKPTELFDFIADEVSRVVGREVDFGRVRPEAERAARRAARGRGEQEITLDAIHVELARALGLDDATREAVKACELEAERRLLRPRRAGRALYEEALRLGKRVVYVSDMYLPRAFLLELLEARGYAEHEGLFVSSEQGVTKGSGALFMVVVRALGVAPESIVHIGDHPHADVHRARSLGLDAIHLPRALETFSKTRACERVYGSPRVAARRPLATRVLMTEVARALHEAPAQGASSRALLGGDPDRLGAQAFGPLLLGFAKWLVETAIERGYEKLFFLARDGRVMLDAYRIVARAYPAAPDADYLLCSRRAANVASLSSKDELASRAMPRRTPSPVAELLEGRFGLSPERVPHEVLARHGMTLDTKVSTKDMERVAALLEDLAPLLLEVAREEREAYLAYLEGLGLRRGLRACVVDIGYRGTMQASLDALLGGDTGLGGLYLLTTYEAETLVLPRGLPIEGYVGQLVDTTREAHALRTHIPVYETLFSGEDTSFVRFTRDGAGVAPVFMPEEPSERGRIALVTAVHREALALCDRVVGAFGEDFRRLDFARDDVLAGLDAYLGRPDPEDARLFEDVPFENAYCAAGAIPIVPRGGRGERMWREGALSVRFGGHALMGPLTRAFLALYGSALARRVRVWPKRFVHASIGRAMSTEDARTLVRNPMGFARALRRRLFGAGG